MSQRKTIFLTFEGDVEMLRQSTRRSASWVCGVFLTRLQSIAQSSGEASDHLPVWRLEFDNERVVKADAF
jgi:hypothetical protein